MSPIFSFRASVARRHSIYLRLLPFIVGIGGSYLFLSRLNLTDVGTLGLVWLGIAVLIGIPSIVFAVRARRDVTVRVTRDGFEFDGRIPGEPWQRVWAWDKLGIQYVPASEYGPDRFSLTHAAFGAMTVVPLSSTDVGKVLGALRSLGQTVREVHT